MLFTKTEIQIAKQISKVGLIIVALCALLVFVTNFVSGMGDTSPNKVDAQVKTEISPVIQKPQVKAEVPLTIDIPGYVTSASVQSPVSNDVTVLDAALGRGAVYYPGSGYPGSNNTLIFGHSTSFKIVRNKAYQIFNNLKSVPVGTLVYIKTQSGTHIYRTRKVEKVSKYTSWIQFKSDTPILTMATCDSFGKASDRWVLVADYVGVR
ncbi:sortase [Candidatus Parcubacteria bacterium]|nr:sortase [Candidatus Parcubacteria bacterium]